MTLTKITPSYIILAIALLYQSWRTFVAPATTLPRPTNPLLADISDRFQAFINNDTSSSSSSSSSPSSLASASSLQIIKKGILRRDLDTFLWNKFAEKFGNNPHTPYMYNTLPLFSYLFPLPSPMWRLSGEGDAVVLLFERPPPVEYFSFTTYILGSWKRGLVFASLGDSLNSHSPMMNRSNTVANNDFFAHVVSTESSGDTIGKINAALVESGISKEAIHVAVIPNSLTAEESKTAFYEVNLRLFRFENQTEGDIYLRSNQPVFYIRGLSSSSTTSKSTTTSVSVEDSEKLSLLPKQIYKDRYHPDSVDEIKLLQSEIYTYRNNLLTNLSQTFNNNNASSSTSIVQTPQTKTIDFSPLYIVGSKCLDTIGHLCLGDSPDAAYFGSNIIPSSDDIQSLILPLDNEFHLVTAVDHRVMRAGIYSSITLLKTNKAVLNKNKLDVRGTSIGALSNNFDHRHHDHRDYNDTATTDDDNNDCDPFFSWIFTRNPEHCHQTKQFVKGCTVIDEREVSRKTYFAYCERIYMNEVTGTGPDWDTILPASIHHFQNVVVQQHQPLPSPNENDTQEYKRENAAIFSRLQLPPSSDVSLKVFEGEERLKFLHIVKTGGESLERYLWNLPSGSTGPFLDYANCRRAAARNLTASYLPVVSNNNIFTTTNNNAPCWAVASTIGVILCGLNCECCANDLLSHDEKSLEGGGGGSGGLHGTLLRSPRSHVLSLFSHGHQAHHTTWKRMASDLPLYAAEGVLRGAEKLCGHSGTDGVSDWKVALEEKLKSSLASWPLVSNAGNNKDDVDDEGSSSYSSNRSITQVTPLRNPQSHAMTCGKSTHGSVAQHFRVLSSTSATSATTDALEPSLEEALTTMHRMEWIGLTDLFHPSLCLLHFQFNRTFLEEDCDCRHPRHYTNNGDDDSSTNNKPLGYWKETRSKKRIVDDLSADVVDLIDAHTTVDSTLFAAALRLVLGRLQRLEELTGASVLECIDWQKLKRDTVYIPGLWSGPESLLPG